MKIPACTSTYASCIDHRTWLVYLFATKTISTVTVHVWCFNQIHPLPFEHSYTVITSAPKHAHTFSLNHSS